MSETVSVDFTITAEKLENPCRSFHPLKDWFNPVLSKMTVLNQEVIYESEEVQVVQLLGRDQSRLDDGVVKASASLVHFFPSNNLPEFVMLFDCGGIEDVDELHSGLAKYGITYIDVLVISHHHIDHFGSRSILNIKPATVFTDKSIPIERDFHFFRDNLIAFRTPGHSNGDLSVIVCSGKRIVLSGDVFDSHNDVGNEDWIQQSNNRTTQARSQKFILTTAEIVIPGHGPAFEVHLTRIFKCPIQYHCPQCITKSADGSAYLLEGYGTNTVAITTSENMDPDDLFGDRNGVEFIIHAGMEEVTKPPKRHFPWMFFDPDFMYRLDENNVQISHTVYESVLGQPQFIPKQAEYLLITRMPCFAGKIFPIIHLCVMGVRRFVPIRIPGASKRESQIINNIVLGFQCSCPALSDLDIEALNRANFSDVN